MCQHAMRANVLTCQHGLQAHVLTCQHPLVPLPPRLLRLRALREKCPNTEFYLAGIFLYSG